MIINFFNFLYLSKLFQSIKTMILVEEFFSFLNINQYPLVQLQKENM